MIHSYCSSSYSAKTLRSGYPALSLPRTPSYTQATPWPIHSWPTHPT